MHVLCLLYIICTYYIYLSTYYFSMSSKFPTVNMHFYTCNKHAHHKGMIMFITLDQLTDVANIKGARPSPYTPGTRRTSGGTPSVRLFSSGPFSPSVPEPLWLHSGPGDSPYRRKVSITKELRYFPGTRHAPYDALRAVRAPGARQIFVDWMNECKKWQWLLFISNTPTGAVGSG